MTPLARHSRSLGAWGRGKAPRETHASHPAPPGLGAGAGSGAGSSSWKMWAPAGQGWHHLMDTVQVAYPSLKFLVASYKGNEQVQLTLMFYLINPIQNIDFNI